MRRTSSWRLLMRDGVITARRMSRRRSPRRSARRPSPCRRSPATRRSASPRGRRPGRARFPPARRRATRGSQRALQSRLANPRDCSRNAPVRPPCDLELLLARSGGKSARANLLEISERINETGCFPWRSLRTISSGACFRPCGPPCGKPSYHPGPTSVVTL